MPVVNVNVWSDSSSQDFAHALSAKLDAAKLLSQSAGLTVAVVRSAEVDLPKTPLLIVALGDFLFPECLAALRLQSDSQVDPAVAWLQQILDRPVLSAGKLDHPSPYWQRRLELALPDLESAAGAVFPVVDATGMAVATAIAVGSNQVIVPVAAAAASLRLPSGDTALQPGPTTAGITRCTVSATLPNRIVRASGSARNVDIAAIAPGAVAPGWVYGSTHDAAIRTPGAALVSLDSGGLVAVQLDTGTIVAAELLTDFVAPAPPPPEEPEQALEAAPRPEDYADRKGYDENFLGVKVPLPTSKLKFKLLTYTNFTVGHQPDRKMALFTAVNLSGKKLTDQTRAGDPWRIDPRLPKDQQIGGNFYTKTPFDRGHMVRRLDPVWGPKSTLAELDTFHYPNSTPQHKDLNRKTWSDLEDYIYMNAEKEHLDVSVFTGPVLRPDDPPYHGVQLPEEFWKIAVIKNRDTGKLWATGYIRSQQELIAGLEFVFGEFRTYQVPISMIEKKTGLDFGSLRSFDPKAGGGIESVEPPTQITHPEDISVAFDIAQFISDLDAALSTFDWKQVSELSRKLAGICHTLSPLPFEEPDARRVLSALRGKRRFEDMVCVAEAFLRAGIGSAQIRRQYAQALIDQGIYTAAESVLRSLLADPNTPAAERREAQGLLGRIAKQVYINAGAPSNPANQSSLAAAVGSYYGVYQGDPGQVWHGINAVALTARAARDRVPVPAVPSGTAADILATLVKRERDSGDPLPAWDLATTVEAHIALGEYDKAFKRAQAYVQATSNGFEIASTLRQLKEVWQLNEYAEPGARLLPLLQAKLLSCEGGQVRLSTPELKLEKVFGPDTSMTLRWYQGGLQCASSIARIEIDHKGFGTGWLVRASDLFPNAPQGKLVLVTNAHVIAPDTNDRFAGALAPEIAEVNFQVQGKRVNAGKVLFHSPVPELDCTIVDLPEVPAGAVPLELDPQALQMSEPPCRLYIIGYPGGRDIEFALHDNQLLALNQRLIHYRTPTEGGSSGSPVFGPTGWRVVALHHAGRKDMPRIDNKPGTYEANEGISIQAIKTRIAAGPVV
ncbi:MAG: DNA/RNA non-specific endonuclease [Bryobacterales bacterium]|nr:DNA/RNA non-specific endonuclease [Bryobacterales bacterium]